MKPTNIQMIDWTASSPRVTRDEMFQLGQQDPTVQSAIMLYELGKCTWEEAMMAAVLTLSQQKASITEALAKLYAKSTVRILP